MVETIHAVIGANFGDEGKGAVTARLSLSPKTLNVLTNGGTQRAHTVVYNGIRHVFQHFGSGTLCGADTYCDKTFIVNPMQFVKEYKELFSKGIVPKVYINPLCRFSTPFDMMTNQIQTVGLLNTCGMGIWETVHRYMVFKELTVKEFFDLDFYQKTSELLRIRRYLESDRISYKLDSSSRWYDVWNDSYLIEHFIQDCDFMKNHISFNLNIDDYDNVVLENGQGLLLTDNGYNDCNRTPSNTGSKAVYSTLNSLGLLNNKVVIHYVTRPYLTRHGGNNLHVVDKEHISRDIKDDETNIYNEHQGDLKYGYLNPYELLDRINEDFLEINIPNAEYIVDITHSDEMFLDLKNCKCIHWDSPDVRS